MCPDENEREHCGAICWVKSSENIGNIEQLGFHYRIEEGGLVRIFLIDAGRDTLENLLDKIGQALQGLARLQIFSELVSIGIVKGHETMSISLSGSGKLWADIAKLSERIEIVIYGA